MSKASLTLKKVRPKKLQPQQMYLPWLLGHPSQEAKASAAIVVVDDALANDILTLCMERLLATIKMNLLLNVIYKYAKTLELLTSLFTHIKTQKIWPNSIKNLMSKASLTLTKCGRKNCSRSRCTYLGSLVTHPKKPKQVQQVLLMML
jgi:hypothetical protein